MSAGSMGGEAWFVGPHDSGRVGAGERGLCVEGERERRGERAARGLTDMPGSKNG